MAPSSTPVRNLDLAVMSVDPRRPWAVAGVGTANTAHLGAFRVHRPVSVAMVTFHVGTQSGNFDIGIFRDNGDGTVTRVGSTGSFACPAPGVQSQALTAPVALVPGFKYWGAFASDVTSGTVYTTATGVLGTLLATVRVMASVGASFPLPPSITLAASGVLSARLPVLVFS